ncbi:ABC transporter substrate-binding protein [Streptomyces sp. NRRL F-5126]|uniref:ABC transporter substrate-binding protein n=1 Tax=Streptomyces sp. NRRL F-5126 TaxID=1463857 RepID=UPI0004C7C0D3|nr:ABC transporter substrate-binding protein [Streptomyces sp. NRRL F-5126]
MNALQVAVRDYPHTRPLKEGLITTEGYDLDFAEVEPIHRAFAPMVRESRYDVSELAVATLLQAVEAGRPVVALPVVLHGNHHHRSIWTWEDSGGLTPEDLRGRRVGVRSYSQTTGMWVRSVLSGTFGVASRDITWVTREEPHVASAQEPANVERTATPLVDLLRAGDLAAVVMGARSADHVEGLVPLIPDWKARQEQHFEEHGWIPINHLAVVRRDLLEERPDAVRAVYRALTRGIDFARPASTGTVRGSVVQYGVTDTLLATLETAIGHAREQGLITSPMTAESLFADFTRHAGA